VPLWRAILSDQLPVVALVGHYPANKLIGREAPRRRNLAAAFLTQGCPRMRICGITRPLGRLSPTVGQVPHVLRTRLPLNWSCPQSRATCMCVRHAASVRPEPGSNSPMNEEFEQLVPND